MSRLLVLTDSFFESFHDVSIPLPSWWKKAEESEALKYYAGYGLGAAYSAIAAVALIQLIRIQLRVPEYGWTTQKLFHLLNCFVAVLRAVVFLVGVEGNQFHPLFLKLVLLDLPGLLFFTTYTLLVLFWAEIYHQARCMPIGFLRPTFLGITVVVYVIEGSLWGLSWYIDNQRSSGVLPPSPDDYFNFGFILSDAFLALVSLSATFGFVLYGGRLLYMLQRFPIESGGRRKKIQEVSLVTLICSACFTVRSIMLILSAADHTELAVDMWGHPLLNIVYYTAVEIVPAAWVLFILRKLPPKRRSDQGYQQIPAQ